MPRTKLHADDVFARFEPWLAALQRLHPPGHDELPAFHRDDVGPRVVWIGVSQFGRLDEDPEPLGDICEALSLLSLLARVDIDAWKAVVLKVWASNWRVRQWVESSVPETFVVGLDFFELLPHWLRPPLSLNDYDVSASAEYGRVREYLEAALQPEDVQDESHLIVRVRVELEVCGEESEDTAEWLSHALDVVKAEDGMKAAQASALNEKRPLLKLTNVDFSSTVAVRIDEAGFKHMHELVNRGIRLSHLPPLEVEPQRKEAPEFVRALRDIACLDGDLEKPGVRTISISDEYSPDVAFLLFSAAQHSSLVRTVEIDIGNGEEYMFDDQRDMWLAAAYSLFNRHADHKIHTLELNVENLQDAEVNAVREVLEAVDPADVGRENWMEDTPKPTVRQLKTSRFMLDIIDEKPDLLFETKSPIAVRVVGEPDEAYPWWTVLFPGQQAAYVLNEDVLSKSEDELELLNRETNTVPAFRRIDITRMSDESMGAVEDLLELIGKETERVDLHELRGEEPVDYWCERVLTVCPKLQELQLRQACLLNLDVFVKAAEEGNCRLRELLALIVPTGESAGHVKTFLNALSDPTHPLTENLQDLDLRLLIDTENSNDVIEPVLRMLRANRRLLSLHLNIQLPDPLKSLLPLYKSALNECFDELVMIRTGPLDIHSKVAFLSVVNEKASDKDSAVGRLDSSVLSIVLQFAAEGQARSFRVTYGLMTNE